MSEQPAIFQRGSFRLHGGAASKWKIECDALTDEDIATIALLLSDALPAFGSVEGVPRGGLRVAEAMRQYVTTGPVLIVDDVCTTGGSLEEHRAGRAAIGAVVFARGVAPRWVTPLWTLQGSGTGGPIVELASVPEHAALEAENTRLLNRNDELDESLRDYVDLYHQTVKENTRLREAQERARRALLVASRLLDASYWRHASVDLSDVAEKFVHRALAALAVPLSEEER